MQMSNSHWFALLNKEFAGTSDRSCVIVAASIIDHLLSEVLRAFLVPCATSQDTLFDGPTAPLGTFGARIDFAHRLGLLSAQSSRDLHLIRRMRNEQAHSVEGRTFEDPGLKDQVTQLAKSFDLQKRAPFLLKPPYDSVRGHFTVVAIMLVVHLDESRKLMPSLKPLLSDSLYTSTYVDSETKSG
jgi:DNA-binding MltR family transcriptional regulator